MLDKDEKKLKAYKKEFEELKQTMHGSDWPAWQEHIYRLIDCLLIDYERLVDQAYTSWEIGMGEDL